MNMQETKHINGSSDNNNNSIRCLCFRIVLVRFILSQQFNLRQQSKITVNKKGQRKRANAREREKIKKNTLIRIAIESAKL